MTLTTLLAAGGLTWIGAVLTAVGLARAAAVGDADRRTVVIRHNELAARRSSRAPAGPLR